jgi:hypothetical protein
MHDYETKPLFLFILALSVIIFFDMIAAGTGKIYVQCYALGLAMLGSSVFYGLVHLVGDRRLHRPLVATVAVFGLIIGSITTFVLAERFFDWLPIFQTGVSPPPKPLIVPVRAWWFAK